MNLKTRKWLVTKSTVLRFMGRIPRDLPGLWKIEHGYFGLR